MEFEAFRGKDVNEVMAAVRAAFGPDAWIGETRHLTNGRGGGLAQQLVEVRAAPGPKTGAEDRGRASEVIAKSASVRRETRLSRKPLVPERTQAYSAPASQPGIVEQLEAIRLLLEELQTSRSPKDRAMSLLQAGHLDGSVAARIARGANSAVRKGDRSLRGWLRDRIAAEVSVKPDPLEVSGRRMILCVGSTGVGKTTTIAKLAARASLELGRRTSIMTLDTYRVGSVEQLSRFAQLIGVPFSVAQDVGGFCDAVLAHRSDLIFVDTASLPPTDVASSRRVMECLAAVPDIPVEVLLVIPATMRGDDAERLVSQYKAPSPTGMVITKLDESPRAGGAVQAAIAGKLPLAYLSRGPRVPEDIESPSVNDVVDTVLPEES